MLNFYSIKKNWWIPYAIPMEMMVHNNSSTDHQPVDTAYIAIEILVAILAAIGNILVIIVFIRYRSVRSITNYYVMSLATADLLVALLGIPFAIATSVGLPQNFEVRKCMSFLFCTYIFLDHRHLFIYTISWASRIVNVIVVLQLKEKYCYTMMFHTDTITIIYLEWI